MNRVRLRRSIGTADQLAVWLRKDTDRQLFGRLNDVYFFLITDGSGFPSPTNFMEIEFTQWRVSFLVNCSPLKT